MKPAPLVSIVVRSMGRPELRRALLSLARQDHPALEVVVVDATGGAHPPLPDVEWAPGHVLRWAPSAHRLNRPQAANVGLGAARGVWVGFVDDDDTIERAHVSSLVSAANDGVAAVYGRGRLVAENGATLGVDGLPFNIAFLLQGRLCPFGALLFRRDIIAGKCRFDESLEVCEDRDFGAQVAREGRFQFVADAVTFNYHVESGQSGAAPGGSRSFLRTERFADRVRARWYGHWAYNSLRPLVRSRRAVQLLGGGRLPEAMDLLQRTLQEHPEDPSVLAGLGLAEHRGRADLGRAAGYIRRAIAVSPARGEYRLIHAEILLREGATDQAVGELRHALSDETARPSAWEALRQLGRAGEGELFKPGEPSADGQGLEALRQAEDCAGAGRHAEAYAWLEAALSRLGESGHVAACARRCFELAHAADRRMAAAAFFDAWLQPRQASLRGDAKHGADVHVVGSGSFPGAIPGATRYASRLAAGGAVQFWSVDSDLAVGGAPEPRCATITMSEFPRDGELVLAGYRFNIGTWLFDTAFHTVGLVVDDAVEPERLVDRAVELDCIPGNPAMAVAFTGRGIAEGLGLAGRGSAPVCLADPPAASPVREPMRSGSSPN